MHRELPCLFLPLPSRFVRAYVHLFPFPQKHHKSDRSPELALLQKTRKTHTHRYILSPPCLLRPMPSTVPLCHLTTPSARSFFPLRPLYHQPPVFLCTIPTYTTRRLLAAPTQRLTLHSFTVFASSCNSVLLARQSSSKQWKKEWAAHHLGAVLNMEPHSPLAAPQHAACVSPGVHCKAQPRCKELRQPRLTASTCQHASPPAIRRGILIHAGAKLYMLPMQSTAQPYHLLPHLVALAGGCIHPVSLGAAPAAPLGAGAASLRARCAGAVGFVIPLADTASKLSVTACGVVIAGQAARHLAGHRFAQLHRLIQCVPELADLHRWHGWACGRVGGPVVVKAWAARAWAWASFEVMVTAFKPSKEMQAASKCCLPVHSTCPPTPN